MARKWWQLPDDGQVSGSETERGSGDFGEAGFCRGASKRIAQTISASRWSVYNGALSSWAGYITNSFTADCQRHWSHCRRSVGTQIDAGYLWRSGHNLRCGRPRRAKRLPVGTQRQHSPGPGGFDAKPACPIDRSDRRYHDEPNQVCEDRSWSASSRLASRKRHFLQV